MHAAFACKYACHCEAANAVQRWRGFLRRTKLNGSGPSMRTGRRDVTVLMMGVSKPAGGLGPGVATMRKGPGSLANKLPATDTHGDGPRP